MAFGEFSPVTTGPTTVPYAATVTPNADTTNLLDIGTLTGNITIANPTGTPINGQRLTFRLKQDATGGRTITWGSAYYFGKVLTKSLITSAANDGTEVLVRWNPSESNWRVVAITPGF